MTRVLFDASTLDDQPSGSKTRLETLVPELEARGVSVTVACVQGRRGPVRRLLAPRALSAAVRRSGADVVVFETLPAPRLDVPMIALVHDLRHVRAGGPRRALAIRWLREAARRARRVHAVSEATRDEILAILPEARGRVDVVPNAVLARPAPDPEALPEDLPERFVFAVGHAEPRKQWPFVAAVAAALREAEVAVVRAGRGGVGHPGVLDLGVVPDAMRDALFARATAVLAPSALEGFGLAPLEALACGAWVVASSIPAHREVLGDAAEFFAPFDLAGAVASVRRALAASPEERAARGRVAVARAATYSPARAADAFLASLRAVLGAQVPAENR